MILGQCALKFTDTEKCTQIDRQTDRHIGVLYSCHKDITTTMMMKDYKHNNGY